MKTQIIHVDGGGMGPDGTGSKYAWINITTNVQRIKYRDNLTNNQAEYRALIYALRNIRKGSPVHVFSDSQLLVNQVNGEWNIKDPELRRLHGRVHRILKERELNMKLEWTSRENNLAGRLI